MSPFLALSLLTAYQFWSKERLEMPEAAQGIITDLAEMLTKSAHKKDLVALLLAKDWCSNTKGAQALVKLVWPLREELLVCRRYAYLRQITGRL